MRYVGLAGVTSELPSAQTNSSYLKSADRKGTNPQGGRRIASRAIACPLEGFDAIGFAAGPVEDFAVAYALESDAHQADSQHVAGRI